jgi:putative SOS response-associated peptidase YedK
VCGRFTLTTPAQVVAQHFGLDSVPLLEPRFNVAPTQPIAIVRGVPHAASRVLELHRWGLIPHWAKDPKIGNRLINARAETVAEKPAFRDAFKRRRCLVPADGFYEWQARSGRKQPVHVRVVPEVLFAIAGLYERWVSAEGEAIDSCTLLTTDANERMRAVHDRMPVILPRETWHEWLDPSQHEPAQLLPLLRPCPAEWLDLHPVSTHVNDPRHDDPICIRPLAPHGEG